MLTLAAELEVFSFLDVTLRFLVVYFTPFPSIMLFVLERLERFARLFLNHSQCFFGEAARKSFFPLVLHLDFISSLTFKVYRKK